MAWFAPKQIVITIKDKEIEKNVRMHSYRHIVDLTLKKGLDHIKELIKEDKLSKDSLDSLVKLIEAARGNTLFRGIHISSYDVFLEHGNNKTSENTSPFEKQELKRLGLKPEEVLYAAPWLGRAWEVVSNENPSIIVLYDGNKLENVGKAYLYKLKKGHNFKDAIKAFVLIKYG